MNIPHSVPGTHTEAVAINRRDSHTMDTIGALFPPCLESFHGTPQLYSNG